MTTSGAARRGVITVAIAVVSYFAVNPHWTRATIIGAVLAGLIALRAFMDQSLSDAKGADDGSDPAPPVARTGANSPSQAGFALIPGFPSISLTAAQKAAKRVQVVGYARSLIGRTEVPRGSNWGPFVQGLLALCGITEPAPWCMAFVVGCFHAKQYLTCNGVTLLIKTASCQEQADHARSVGLLVAAASAIGAGLEPGWVMLVWEPQLRRYGHGGIVSKVDLYAKTFKSIEGNTNDDGGREGYEVMEHTRRILDVATDGHAKYAFIQAG